jgi:hypothetical protein
MRTEKTRFVAALVTLCALCGVVFGYWYDYGKDPKIGKIYHETVLEPEPFDRTTIGVGEEVTCWIDPDTWEDLDEKWGEYGLIEEVEDEMGKINWYTNGNISVNPTCGPVTTLTADGPDEAAELYVEVDDAALFADDDLAVQFVVFQNAAPGGLKDDPTGATTGISSDAIPGDWTKVGKKNKFGASTSFLLQVEPTNVNFSHLLFNVEFKEIKRA